MAGCMLDVSKYLIKIRFHVYYIHVCVLYSGMYLGIKSKQNNVAFNGEDRNFIFVNL